MQVIKSVYSLKNDIVPNSFTVEAGRPVRFEIKALDTAYGCMNTILIQGLWNKPIRIVKGQDIVMEFIPNKPGNYVIACAMGVPRGTVIVK